MEAYKNVAKEIGKKALALFAEREQAQAAYEAAKLNYESAASRYDKALVKYDANHSFAVFAKAEKDKAQADFDVARAELHDVEVAMPDKAAKIVSDGREAAEKAMNQTANPADIDRDALELLKSGVLTLNEYADMLDGYREGGNEAMKRLAMKYAKDAREDAAKHGSTYSNDASYSRLTMAITECGGGETRRQFDALFDAISRTGRNSALIPMFENTVAAVVAAL